MNGIVSSGVIDLAPLPTGCSYLAIAFQNVVGYGYVPVATSNVCKY
jgi:hypothetical protein